MFQSSSWLVATSSLVLCFPPCFGLVNGPVTEVWDEAPTSVTIKNPYFERVQIAVTTSFITEVGVLHSCSVAEECHSMIQESDAVRLKIALKKNL